jgi:signal transduction histidine kinase
LHGLRVVDPNDKGGGVPRHILVVYGSPTARLWRQVNKAIVFFSFSSLALLLVTGILMAWLLHRGLAPMRRLAAEAEGISAQRWNFRAPESAMATVELAPLATALTAAMQRLEASFSQQKRFVSDAAHELKTAVAVVKSSLQLLTLRQRTAEEYEAGVQTSLADSERMEEIVARMLTLARAEHTEGESSTNRAADLTECVQATMQQFQSMAEIRRVDLSLDAPAEIFVSLSPEECTLLCSNLVLNALQHSPAHSTVKVQIGNEDGRAELRVEDEGDGIDPALLPHVFERFSRGDPSRSRNTGGTGLGLAICKAIIDRAGGRIALESERDRGTTAIVRLPFTDPPEDAILPEPALHSSPSA